MTLALALAPTLTLTPTLALIITPDNTAQFQREWLRLDPVGTYFIPSVHFPQLLGRLTPPLGVRGLRLDSSQLLEYMRALQIPDRNGRMHFQEVRYLAITPSRARRAPPGSACALPYP